MPEAADSRSQATTSEYPGASSGQSSFDSFARNPDFQALEAALWRVSQGRMTAMIEDVVRVAAEAFAFPFDVSWASRCLGLSGRYQVIDGIVEPLSGPP